MPWNTVITTGLFVAIPVIIITTVVYFIKKETPKRAD